MVELLRLYTLSESSDQGLAAMRARIGLLLLFRGIAFAAGLAFALIFPLIDLVFQGAKDLADRSFAAFLFGEGLGLAYSVPAAVRAFPLTTLIHILISVGWLYWLWVYGQPAWHQLWLTLPSPAG